MLGTVKNALVVVLGIALLAETVTPLQGLGYAISVGAFFVYQVRLIWARLCLIWDGGPCQRPCHTARTCYGWGTAELGASCEGLLTLFHRDAAAVRMALFRASACARRCALLQLSRPAPRARTPPLSQRIKMQQLAAESAGKQLSPAPTAPQSIVANSSSGLGKGDLPRYHAVPVIEARGGTPRAAD